MKESGRHFEEKIVLNFIRYTCSLLTQDNPITDSKIQPQNFIFLENDTIEFSLKPAPLIDELFEDIFLESAHPLKQIALIATYMCAVRPPASQISAVYSEKFRHLVYRMRKRRMTPGEVIED